MKKRRYSAATNNRGSALVAAIIILIILFLAGLLSLLALYYMNSQKTTPVIPPRISTAESVQPPDVGTGTAKQTQESTSAQQPETAEQPEPQTAKEPSAEETTAGFVSDDPDLPLKEKVLEHYGNLGVITGVRNYLNMREGPSTDTDLVGVIFKNCAVDILEESNGWLRVSSGGAVGYVSAEYVTTGAKARSLALSSMAYRAQVLPDTLDVCYEPDENSDVMTSILKGERYDILGYSGEWVEVNAVEGLSGYVHQSDISAGYFLDEAIVFSFDGVSELRQDIIRKAFEYYGGEYVWNGTTLGAGVDCSGFTMRIYELFGITLTRNSYTQAEQGTVVTESTIRPGDLIFYVGRTPAMIGHVAIYIGDDKIIHAASESKGICVSNWKFVPPVCMRDVIGD